MGRERRRNILGSFLVNSLYFTETTAYKKCSNFYTLGSKPINFKQSTENALQDLVIKEKWTTLYLI